MDGRPQLSCCQIIPPVYVAYSPIHNFSFLVHRSDIDLSRGCDPPGHYIVPILRSTRRSSGCSLDAHTVNLMKVPHRLVHIPYLVGILWLFTFYYGVHSTWILGSEMLVSPVSCVAARCVAVICAVNWPCCPIQTAITVSRRAGQFAPHSGPTMFT
jgi:hypothetical protein